MNSPTVRNSLRSSLSALPAIVLCLSLVGPAVPDAQAETIKISVSGSRSAALGFGDEDIVSYETVSGSWMMWFDGSDVGLLGADVSAFAQLADGSIVMAFAGTTSVPGVGQVTPSDLAQFEPSSLGSTTSGIWSLYFDGSDVGLGRVGIDAVEVLEDGSLILSTAKGVVLSGIDAAAHDLSRFTPVSLGPNTSGTWEMYFDGSDAGLGPAGAENTSGVALDGFGDLYLTTQRGASLPSLRTSGGDILRCTPLSLGAQTSCAWALHWSLPETKGNSVVIDGIDR